MKRVGPPAVDPSAPARVYVDFRVWDPSTQRVENVRGLRLLATGFSPVELFDVFLRALEDHVAELQRLVRQQAVQVMTPEASSVAPGETRRLSPSGSSPADLPDPDSPRPTEPRQPG